MGHEYDNHACGTQELEIPDNAEQSDCRTAECWGTPGLEDCINIEFPAPFSVNRFTNDHHISASQHASGLYVYTDISYP